MKATSFFLVFFYYKEISKIKEYFSIKIQMPMAAARSVRAEADMSRSTKVAYCRLRRRQQKPPQAQQYSFCAMRIWYRLINNLLNFFHFIHKFRLLICRYQLNHSNKIHYHSFVRGLVWAADRPFAKAKGHALKKIWQNCK